MLILFDVTTSPSREVLNVSGGTPIKPPSNNFMLSLLGLTLIASLG